MLSSKKTLERSSIVVQIEVHELRKATNVAAPKFTASYFLPAPRRTGCWSNQMFYWRTVDGLAPDPDRMSHPLVNDRGGAKMENEFKRRVVYVVFSVILLGLLWLGWLVTKGKTNKP